MSTLDAYSHRYRFIRFERRDGILQITLHLDGGPAQWSAYPGGIHAELGQAFHDVGHDLENRVIILTGTGDFFLDGSDRTEPSESNPVQFWDRIYREGKDLLQNLLDIPVPVIAAVNGPVFIHAEIPVLSDLVLASDRASFADKVHFLNNIPPADGVHILWPMILGPNRGRAFLLTGEEITAQEAKALGFVAEVVPHDQLLARAWEVARQFATRSDMTLRMTRAALTQHLKRRVLDDLGYGLQLEGMAILAAAQK